MEFDDNVKHRYAGCLDGKLLELAKKVLDELPILVTAVEQAEVVITISELNELSKRSQNYGMEIKPVGNVSFYLKKLPERYRVVFFSGSNMETSFLEINTYYQDKPTWNILIR